MAILKEGQVKEILDKMDDIFDSHDFIFEFMRKFPNEYVKELYKYYIEHKKEDPITGFHRKISIRVLKTRKDLIEGLGKFKSCNVRMSKTPNEIWRKI